MTTRGSRGFFQQGNEADAEVQQLGKWLSQTIHCVVRYPAFGKHVFECSCGVLFPVFAVKAHDVESILNLHSNGYRPDEVQYKKE